MVVKLFSLFLSLFLTLATFRVSAESLDPLVGLITADLKVETVYDKVTGEILLPVNSMLTFLKIASAQAQIWGDTILEGDYAASNDTQIDHIDALTRLGAVIAYRIVYSQQAWNTSTCSYTGRPKELDQCEEGRIREASFVSPDLLSWLRDPKAYADFESK